METFCTNIRNNLLQNCSAKYLPSRKLKFEDQPLKCYNSKTRLSQTGFPIYFLIFTTSSITSPITYMVVLLSESVLFRFCSDRNLFRDLSDKVLSRVLFSVLSDSVLFIVLNDMVLSRVLSDRNVCRILSDRVLLRVLSDRVLFRVLKNRALFRVFKDRVFFRVLIPRFPTYPVPLVASKIWSVLHRFSVLNISVATVVSILCMESLMPNVHVDLSGFSRDSHANV